MNIDRKKHWETVYETKQPHEVSWTQQVPKPSLELVQSLRLQKDAKIIDVGGGDSHLADSLLDLGFEDITVLDISSKALVKMKKRLGERADKIKFIISDVLNFKPETHYDLWHDRATFHFLTSSDEINGYLKIARNTVTSYMILGTFSETGPKKCSGLEVKNYSEVSLEKQLKRGFKKIRCFTEDHQTPSGSIQNFLFCSFKRNEN